MLRACSLCEEGAAYCGVLCGVLSGAPGGLSGAAVDALTSPDDACSGDASSLRSTGANKQLYQPTNKHRKTAANIGKYDSSSLPLFCAVDRTVPRLCDQHKSAHESRQLQFILANSKENCFVQHAAMLKNVTSAIEINSTN